jgi:hypothetical protein
LTSVESKNLKFGERLVLGGSSFRAGEKKRACFAFSLTVRKSQRDKKLLIEDYFSNDSSPENKEEIKRVETGGPRPGEHKK